MNLRMKHLRVLIITFCLALLCLSTYYIHEKRYIREDNENIGDIDVASLEQEKKPLVLNAIGKNADDISVTTLDIPDECRDVFEQQRVVYEVEAKKYSKRELKHIATELDTKVLNVEKTDNGCLCELKNNGTMMCYEESGTITYISNKTNVVPSKVNSKFNKRKCLNVAELFLKESKIIGYDDVYLSSIEIGYTAETIDGIIPLSYQIIYLKKSPNEVDGFTGVGPGIIIDINSDYEVSSFTSIDKDIVEIDKYDTISVAETEKNIENSVETQVMVDPSAKIDQSISNVMIDNVSICLYCDSAGLEQQYMVPYYVLEGKDSNGVDISITTLALSEEDCVIK